MVYALYYKNELQYKRACSDLAVFKDSVYARKSKIFSQVGYTDNYNNFNKVFSKKYIKTVDYWTVRQYSNYSKVLQTISEQNTARKGRGKSVNNYFYVLDTETTNYKNKYAFCYLYGIRKYNFHYDMNDDNLEKYAGLYKAFYNKNAVKDFTNYILSINKEAEKADKLTYIYIHNLQYDLFELIQNIFINCEITEQDYNICINDSIYRGSATKPLRFRFKHLVFIDSLALTNKSLKKISNNHKIKKQEELKTYKEQYFFGSELPPDELIYNKYDLDVTALGIMDSIRSLKTEFTEFNDYVKTYVSTVTGASKYLNKHIYKDSNENKLLLHRHTYRASGNLPIDEDNNIDIDRVLFYQRTFQGGFTHCNPFFAYNINEAADSKYIFISFDKKSHYPATMTMRNFPLKFNVIEENKTELLKQYHAENLEQLNFYNEDEFIKNMLNFECTIDRKEHKLYRDYFIPCKHHFICEVTLKNVKVKIYENYNCMPLIAVSKSDIKGKKFFDKNNIIDNGKILQAKRVKIVCTNLDLLAYALMYEFEIAECSRLEYTYKNNLADDYIQKTVRYHLVNKNELDLCLKHKKSIDELTDFSGSPLFSDTQLNNIAHMSEKEQLDFLKSEYQATKTCGLNNQYGINVQKLVNDNITFNLKEFKFIKEENTLQGCRGTQTTRDYITGLYITAYARLDLAFMTFLVYKHNPDAQVVYWDTDSLKIKVLRKNKKAVIKTFELYNEKINRVREEAAALYGTLYNLGIWELDGEYKTFYSMGAKKYVVYKYDKELKKWVVEVTNAGVNKKQFSEILTKFFYCFKMFSSSDYEAFKKLLNYAYHPNLLIGSDITGRKTIKYPNIHDKKVKLKATDENGKQFIINQYPTALIIDCDYSLTDIKMSLLNKMHYQLCKTLQLQEGIKFNCNTDYNSIGNIVNELTDDNSDFIIFD